MLVAQWQRAPRGRTVPEHKGAHLGGSVPWVGLAAVRGSRHEGWEAARQLGVGRLLRGLGGFGILSASVCHTSHTTHVSVPMVSWSAGAAGTRISVSCAVQLIIIIGELYVALVRRIRSQRRRKTESGGSDWMTLPER